MYWSSIDGHTKLWDNSMFWLLQLCSCMCVVFGLIFIYLSNYSSASSFLDLILHFFMDSSLGFFHLENFQLY